MDLKSRITNHRSGINSIIVSFSFLLVLLLYVNSYAEELKRAEAINILIQEVIERSPNRDVLMAFGPRRPLKPGDLVEPVKNDAGPFPAVSRKIEHPTWFFWIDDEPDAKFVHPVRFVYIDARHPKPVVGDGIIVDHQGLWPKINGESYLGGEYERFFTTNDRVYGEPPETTY